MSASPEPKVSPEEYLAGERQAESKHEYVNGEVYAMAGASRLHNLIVSNLVRELGTRLKGKRCEVYPSDMRLQVEETGLYTYPDVMVVCARPRFPDGQRDTLLNPKVIIEVLSEATEANDRGWKWAHYRQLDSLVEYVMVAQDRHRVEHFVRQPDGTWVFREYRSLEDSLRPPSLGCEVPLAEIYYLVEFGQEGRCDAPDSDL
ncbi:MAG: Uma2 family endonuclease [Armatimonadetes bacterium]|nr:Uma2 family endonuclease [Armatimonadota bacterium]